jgi:hypothetical protein
MMKTMTLWLLMMKLGILLHISIDRVGQTEDRSKSPAPGSMVTGNHTPYRPVFHNLFLTTSRHWGFQTFFEYRTEAVIEKKRYRAHPNFEGVGPGMIS